MAPQRLRDLSQSWADLAVRGFDKSAQAEVDKNDRQRAQLQGIANVVSTGIVRKKGRDRQDKLRAEENAREDSIRRERYGREDARYAVEDSRYTDRKQTERDVLALKLTQDEMERVTEEARNSGDPASQQAVMGRYAELQSRYEMLTGRLMGSAQQAAQASPAAENSALREGLPASGRPPPTQQDVAPVRPMSKGDPYKIPATQPWASGQSALLNPKAGPRALPPAAPPPEMPPSAVPAAPVKAPDPTFLTPSGQQAVVKAKEAASLGAQYDRLNNAAQEVLRRKNSAKTPGAAFQLEARYRALMDDATKAREGAKEAGMTAQLYETKAREEVQAQAKMGEQRTAIIEAMNEARAWGPRAIGGFAKAWTQGVRDPGALRSFAVGAMKAKEAEAALAAKATTPAQRAAQAQEEGTLEGIKGKAREAANPKAKPTQTEDEWQADMLSSALKKYEADTREPAAGGARSPVRWDIYTDDEVAALMNAKDVSPDLRALARTEFNKREVPRAVGDAIRGVKAPMPFGGDKPAPKAEAPAKPGGLDAAKTAFNNLPASERDTPEKARAAKARIMAEYGVR